MKIDENDNYEFLNSNLWKKQPKIMGWEKGVISKWTWNKKFGKKPEHGEWIVNPHDMRSHSYQDAPGDERVLKYEFIGPDKDKTPKPIERNLTEDEEKIYKEW